MNSDALTLPTAAAMRFDWIVRGEEVGPDPVCDVPVRSTLDAVAIPTVGAIVPNWVLIVPRVRAISMADLAPNIRRSMLCFGKKVALEMRGGTSPVFFEHGARLSGDVVGCGVDQAHFRIAPGARSHRHDHGDGACRIDLRGCASG
jgi:ATP adenylyltransferase